MSDKAKEFFQAFSAGKMSRRELMLGAGKLGLAAGTAELHAERRRDPGARRRFRLEEVHKGKTVNLLLNKHPYADAMIADLDELQDADRHGRHLRHLPGGRLFRQGDGRAVVEVDAVRRLHDRRLHDLDLRPGRLDRRPQRVHQGSRQDQPELRLGRRAAGPARLDCVERRAGRRTRLGQDAKQWCMPWGFELNSITYNRKMFDKVGVSRRRTSPT